MGCLQAVDPFGRRREGDPVPDKTCPDAEGDREVALACPGRDSDRLQHLRQSLPCEVRVTATTHPLFGRLLRASGFRRRSGVLLLVVDLPDGTPGTIRADATNAFVDAVADVPLTVLSVEGMRQLRRLTAALVIARSRDRRVRKDRGGNA
jgi:hypothetical protein